MRSLVFGIALTLAAATMAHAQEEPKSGKDKFGPGHTGKIDWIFGFEKGSQEANWAGRPMMVFFTATW